MLGHFVSYTLRFPNKNTWLSFCLETLAVFAPSEPTRFGSAMKIYKYIFAALTSLMFHVKHAIASVAKICLHIFMTEHEHVGHEVSKHCQYFCSELKFSITFLESNSQTPLPYKNHKIVVDNILINVEKLLRWELRKVCLHTFHSRGASFALAQKLLSRMLRKQKISC